MPRKVVRDARAEIRAAAAKIPRKEISVSITLYSKEKKTVAGIKVGDYPAVHRKYDEFDGNAEVGNSKNRDPWVITHIPSGVRVPGDCPIRIRALELAWLLNTYKTNHSGRKVSRR